jgi:AcrR family transcriptional regulator
VTASQSEPEFIFRLAEQDTELRFRLSSEQAKLAEMASTTPTSATSRPLRADARRNRERILAAARDVFAKAGRDVQMPEVARAAGVGVGTLYRHFPAKEDLVRALVRDKVQAGIETASEALARDDPWEAIEWLVNESAARMAVSRGLRDAMSVIDFGDENPWNTDEARRCAAAVLDRARDASAIRADLTVDDWQALMCGLSAAIATGADAARQAEFVLSAVRSR